MYVSSTTRLTLIGVCRKTGSQTISLAYHLQYYIQITFQHFSIMYTHLVFLVLFRSFEAA